MTLCTPRVGSGMRCTGTRREDEEGWEGDEEGWEEDEEGREEDEEGWVWWVDVTAYLSNTALQRTHLPVQSISSLCGLTQAV